MFKPNEETEDYHIRKPNDGNFLFKIGDKKYIYVGEKVFTFQTNDTILIILQNSVLTILNSHMPTVKETLTLCDIENIFLFKNIKLQH